MRLVAVPLLIALSAAAAAELQPATPQARELPQPPAATQQQLNQKLQAHLSAVHAHAQRQLGQLNGLVLGGATQLAANQSSQPAGAKYGNALEALASVGKAITSHIASQGVQIVGQDASGNSRKNEYQPVVAPLDSQAAASGVNASANYREQGEILRQEIMRRAGQLQQVVASSTDALKNNGDLIVRRLLDQLNHRLDAAKSKADRIINEPATSEVALKALGTINQGLNSLNSIITNLANRLDLSAKDGANSLSGQVQRVSGDAAPLLDTNRLRQNLQQLGQQFHSAIQANQQQAGKWPQLGAAQAARSR